MRLTATAPRRVSAAGNLSGRDVIRGGPDLQLIEPDLPRRAWRRNSDGLPFVLELAGPKRPSIQNRRDDLGRVTGREKWPAIDRDIGRRGGVAGNAPSQPAR